MSLADYAALVQASVNQNNQWSAQQAANQMKFQERMSSTAHQREVADLKAAGLNPVLSAHSNGAAAPSGAMGTTDTSGTSALVELLKEFSEGIASSAASGAAFGFGRSQGNSNSSKGIFDSYDDSLLEAMAKNARSPAEQVEDALNTIAPFLPYKWEKRFKALAKTSSQVIADGLEPIGRATDKLGAFITKVGNSWYDKTSAKKQARVKAAIKDWKANPVKYW